MRTTLLSVASLLTCIATAQPLVQYGNVNLIGTSFNLKMVTNSGSSDPSANGANVTWDFSTATVSVIGTATFVPVASTPFASSYPAANLAMIASIQGSTGYSYYTLSSSQLDLLAEHVGTDGEQVYTTPKTILEFPLGYNDSFVDTYAYGGDDFTVTRAYTGYGTVILPGGETATAVVKTTSTSGSIAFFQSNPVLPLVSIEDSGIATWWDVTSVGMNEVTAGPLLAWPNPTADRVRMNTEAEAQWSVLDLQGRTVLQGNATNTTCIVDLGAVQPGQYVLRVLERGVLRTVAVTKQ